MCSHRNFCISYYPYHTIKTSYGWKSLGKYTFTMISILKIYRLVCVSNIFELNTFFISCYCYSNAISHGRCSLLVPSQLFWYYNQKALTSPNIFVRYKFLLDEFTHVLIFITSTFISDSRNRGTWMSSSPSSQYYHGGKHIIPPLQITVSFLKFSWCPSLN